MSDEIKILCDTNIFIAIEENRGLASEFITLTKDPKCTLYLCKATIDYDIFSDSSQYRLSLPSLSRHRPS